MMDYLFLGEVAAKGTFPVYFVVVYVVGFIAAVGIGSIAWYSSKRPVGWEDAEKPTFIPEVKPDKSEEKE
jgi:hypothetical protein